MPKPYITSDSTWMHVVTTNPSSTGYRPEHSGKWVVPGTVDGLRNVSIRCINAGLIEQSKVLRNNKLYTVACFYIDVDNARLHRQFIRYIKALGIDLNAVYYKLDSETNAGVLGRPVNPIISPSDFL